MLHAFSRQLLGLFLRAGLRCIVVTGLGNALSFFLFQARHPFFIDTGLKGAALRAIVSLRFVPERLGVGRRAGAEPAAPRTGHRCTCERVSHYNNYCTLQNLPMPL